jgi:hypothetical protein
MDKKQVEDFVKNNVIPVKSGRKCVDGRYKAQDENSGMIARPGGDAGYLEILLALQKQGKIESGVEDWVNKLVEALEELNEEFYAHTDHRADTSLDNFSIGCGHLAKAANEELSIDYLVVPESMKKAIICLKSLASKGEIKLVSLEGEHKEVGVLVNIGVNNSVDSQDGEQMYFIYDKTRDEEFMEKLFNNLSLDGVSLEEFKKISETQLNATLKNLASGLPVYEVNVDLVNPEIKFVSTI